MRAREEFVAVHRRDLPAIVGVVPHHDRRVGIERRVDAGSTLQRVVAAATGQDVVTRRAGVVVDTVGAGRRESIGQAAGRRELVVDRNVVIAVQVDVVLRIDVVELPDAVERIVEFVAGDGRAVDAVDDDARCSSRSPRR